MKKLFIFLFTSALTSAVSAQVKAPVSWTFAAEKVGASTYKVVLTAELEEGWHVYSQSTPAGGPVPTKISFSQNPLAILVGKPTEAGKLQQRHEPLFGVDVKQFSNKVSFVQMVKVKGSAKTSLTGSVVFMSCNEEECLPPKTQKFTIALK